MNSAFSVLERERHSLRTVGLIHCFAGAANAVGVATKAKIAREERSMAFDTSINEG